MSNDNKSGLLAFNQGGNVVEAVLNEVGMGNGLGLLILLQGGDLLGSLLEALSLLLLVLWPVLVEESEQVLG